MIPSDIQVPRNNHVFETPNVFKTHGRVIMIWFPRYMEEFYERWTNLSEHSQIGNVSPAAINMRL